MNSNKRSTKTYKKKSRTSKPYATNWLSRYKPSSSAISAPSVGLGRSLKTKLKTVFFANCAHDGTGVFKGYLNPGSCFDPTGDISTVQPAGYDQLAALYARYLVTGATVTIEVVPSIPVSATGNIFNSICAAYPSTVSTALATYQGAASQPYAQSGIYGPNHNVKMFFKLDTQKIVGSRLPVIAEDAGALVGANPTNGQSIVLPIFLQYATAAAVTSIIKVTIIQDVIFDQRIQVVDA